jgi:uncharacterized protein (DUF362 family)
MSEVVAEYERELAELRVAHQTDPEGEARALYLVALEREQLVTIAYSGDSLHARIDAMEASDEVKALVHHAMFWAARDEDMHTTYVRGVLFRRGMRLLAMRALGQQLGGLLAGWSSAISQHTTWSDAPISRGLACLIAGAGLVAGKVPKSARKTLQHQSFRGFAQFNAEAEVTAGMCWARLAEVIPEQGHIYRRIAEDEFKHARVFAALVAAFDEHDRCLTDASTLAGHLREVDPIFIPARYRETSEGLGCGGTVYVREGDPHAPTDLLRAAALDTGLLDQVFAELRNKSAARREGVRVVIKTEFMMAYDRRDRTPVVDPALLAALVSALRARGAGDITVLECANLFDHYYGGRSVAEVAAFMEMLPDGVRLVDASQDQVPFTFARGIGQSSVCRSWRDADLRISLAKMRTNPSFLVHLCCANLETLGQRIDNLLFTDRVADASTALMMTLDAFPCHLAILDASHDVPDGLTGIMGTAEPRHPGRVYAARDPVALDWVATRHMGLGKLPRATSCRAALDWFGDVRPLTVVDGPDTPIDPFTSPLAGDGRVLLAALAYPVYAFLSSGGAWWVPKMDATAFPLLRREDPLTFVARRLLRRLFRFGSPVEEWE